MCPECRAGKHGNCDGHAWDFDKDEPAICTCWANNHGQEQQSDQGPMETGG